VNFLAHAHLAYLTQTSITGNLLGDFVKGNVINNQQPSWQLGIRLHRKIDIYTDTHDLIKQLKIELGPLRRYGGIVIDILLDHIIAKNFAQLGQLELSVFSQLVYQDLAVDRAKQPDHFKVVTDRMIHMDWLTNYQELAIIEQALIRTAQRLSTKPDFRPALVWYEQHHQRIDKLGLHFYQQLITHSFEQSVLLKM